MDIVFMGTPDFSVPSLKKLILNHNVKAVFTQPDRPKGRGNKVAISPVKELALENNIPVYQPLKIRNDIESINIISNMQPDFIIVVAFGQILPKEILDIPKYGCINLHASLLPRYRGAAPINYCIINGEKVTGNTTMFMSEGLDCGDILLRDEIKIEDAMTAGELHDILRERGSDLLLRTIDGVVKDEIIRIKQDDSKSCYAPMLTRETGKIRWSDMTINEIKNLIQGLNPSPTAHTLYKGLMMKIYNCDILDEIHNNVPGYIIGTTKDGIKVCAKDGLVILKKIQFPGGKPLFVSEYLKGHSVDSGVVLE